MKWLQAKEIMHTFTQFKQNGRTVTMQVNSTDTAKLLAFRQLPKSELTSENKVKRAAEALGMTAKVVRQHG